MRRGTLSTCKVGVYLSCGDRELRIVSFVRGTCAQKGITFHSPRQYGVARCARRSSELVVPGEGLDLAV